MSRSMRTRALSLSESARIKGVSNFSSGASIPPAFSSSVFSCFASSLKSSKGTGFAVGEDCAVGADDKHAPMVLVVECSRVRRYARRIVRSETFRDVKRQTVLLVEHASYFCDSAKIREFRRRATVSSGALLGASTLG